MNILTVTFLRRSSTQKQELMFVWEEINENV